MRRHETYFMIGSAMADAEKRLVVFDCDGVLVDSEPLSIAVLVEAMREEGVEISEEEAYERFLGRSLATLVETLHREFHVFAGEAFLERIRKDLYARFRAELKPIKGIAETLDALDMPRCVASSSQMERIRLSLGVTGLLDRLEPDIFSATMVKRGKPAPDLFLPFAIPCSPSTAPCRRTDGGGARGVHRRRGQPGGDHGGEGGRYDRLCLYRRLARKPAKLPCGIAPAFAGRDV